jgi:hypothetical protein
MRKAGSRKNLLLAVGCLACLATACKKDPTCPPYRYEDKDLCKVDYTSLQDIQLDGAAAVGKRAKISCLYDKIITNDDGEPAVVCWSVGQFQRPGHRAYFYFPTAMKDKIKTLSKEQTVVVDMVVISLGKAGVGSRAFTLD